MIPTDLADALAGSYTLEREVGQGGMAVVYLARDVKHERAVAIKVLHSELSASLGAKRFLREVKIAAQLQHPNILPLLDSGEAAGRLYFVMPYVAGQSLRERLAREGELPIHDAMRLIAEIVDALALAHQHGVVHRDIKPDNVMLSGRHALVTDFGVAKAISEATGASTVTTLGVAVGTPAYMSPEQAAADPHVDHRSDIYSVGVMAYELVAGRPPFAGTTPQQVLAAHVTQAPDPVVKWRPSVPAALDAMIMKCLEKRPADRWQTAAELLAQLDAFITPTMGLTPVDVVPIRPRPRRMAPVWTIAAVLVLGVAAGWWMHLRRQAPSIALGSISPVTTDPGLEIDPAMSPDGKFVAYVAASGVRTRLYVRPLDGGRTVAVTDDSMSSFEEPEFSRDGGRLLFLGRGGVFTAPALGGAADPIIAPVAQTAPIVSAAWSPTDDRVAFVRRDSLLVMTLATRAVAAIGHYRKLHSCRWSSDGALLACVSDNPLYVQVGSTFGNRAVSQVLVISAEGGRFVAVTDSVHDNQSPCWIGARRLMYVSDRGGPRDIYAIDVSASGRVLTNAARISTGLNAHTVSASANGARIAYSAYVERSNIWATAVPDNPPAIDPPLTQITHGNQLIESFSAGPGGRSIVYDSDEQGHSNVYRLDLETGQTAQLTHDSVANFAPHLSPDGSAVTFFSFRTGIRDVFVVPLATGIAERPVTGPGERRGPNWSPDGKALVFSQNETLYVVRRGADGHWLLPRGYLADGGDGNWSGDGSVILQASRDGGVQVVDASSGVVRSLYKVAQDGQAPVALDAPQSAPGAPGKYYFKSLDALGRASFWEGSLSGGPLRMIVALRDTTRRSSRVEWTVDAKRFYFTISERQSDIWVADIERR